MSYTRTTRRCSAKGTPPDDGAPPSTVAIPCFRRPSHSPRRLLRGQKWANTDGPLLAGVAPKPFRQVLLGAGPALLLYRLPRCGLPCSWRHHGTWSLLRSVTCGHTERVWTPSGKVERSPASRAPLRVTRRRVHVPFISWSRASGGAIVSSRTLCLHGQLAHDLWARSAS